MPTIYKRIKFLKLNPSQDIKKKIGEEVCATYFSQKNRAKVFKIESVEPEGTFQALSYPKKFRDVIDKIILKHCMPSVDNSEKKKRPRLNKVYNAKPK